jgi:DNA-binding FrmR family transcriptional regulator
MQHTSHLAIVRNLKQAQGQLEALMAMFVEGRSCPELAQQLQAVESIVRNAKRTLIHDHMEHCIADAATSDAKSADEARRQFKALTKNR